jgi:hypothetical protein
MHDRETPRYALIRAKFATNKRIHDASIEQKRPRPAPQLRQRPTVACLEPVVELFDRVEPQVPRTFVSAEVRRLRDAVLRADRLLDCRRTRLEAAIQDAISISNASTGTPVSLEIRTAKRSPG